MGTPEFAVATLGSLLMNGYNVVGVVTAPDKPAGRGQRISRSAVKEFAEFSSLPVMQPPNLKDPEFAGQLKELDADIFLVVAFRMLPEVIWKIPRLGTINLHASLLPHYRGAAPINHVLINGETTTGVTTFYINESIDTGNILLREEIHIYPFENAGDLHKRLMKLGARLVIKTIKGIVDNSIEPVSQERFLKPGEIPLQAPKISPDDCIIDWRKSCLEIHNLIRGLAPAPCAKSFLTNENSTLSFKIFEAFPDEESVSFDPGRIVTDGRHSLRITCGKGSISITSIQLEGKKRMSIGEFLNGFRAGDYRIAFR